MCKFCNSCECEDRRTAVLAAAQLLGGAGHLSLEFKELEMFNMTEVMLKVIANDHWHVVWSSTLDVSTDDGKETAKFWVEVNPHVRDWRLRISFMGETTTIQKQYASYLFPTFQGNVNVFSLSGGLHGVISAFDEGWQIAATESVLKHLQEMHRGS